MKVTKTMLALLALPMISIATAQNAPVPTMAPGAKQIQAAPKTMEEALKFLPDTVMVVNGKKITKADVIKNMKSVVPEQYIGMLPQDKLKTIVSNSLNFEIMAALAEKAGLKPSEAEVKAMLNADMAKLTPEQKKQLEERFAAEKKTINQAIDELAKDPKVREEIAINKWISQKIAPVVSVKDEDVLKFYNDNKAMFVTPAKIKAAHILIKPENKDDKASVQKAEAKAKAVLGQLKQGADFGVLAETESACPSGKRSKGFLGEMTQQGLDQDFWNAAVALKKGEISGVVKTQFGYHIIRLDDKEEGKPVKFEEVKSRLTAQLKEVALGKKIQEAVEAAKKSGFAKISNF